VKSFYCDCGQRVFFENDTCLVCGRALGFDFETLSLRTLDALGDGTLTAADGRRYWRCVNHVDYGNCNWLLPAGHSEKLCPSCRLNEVIPALDRPDNLELWTGVERAKRRLLYSLRKLGLPLSYPDGGSLRFRIMEDRRRNPSVQETFVATAHLDGAITVNIMEADAAARTAVREQMRERYRTVLGHLRHESAHFYFTRLTSGPGLLDECRSLFGDEREDYGAALERHYANGAPADWPERFVSAYASAHPAEDFAETFAHFLHIDDALETAGEAGLGKVQSVSGERDWIGNWITLAITLNEILRSLGSEDPYPFVLTRPVREKLAFIGRLVCPPTAPAAG